MLKFEPLEIERKTFVDKIVEIVEDRISSGIIAPQSIISETTLAKEFGVSRGPAREALLRLGEMGLVVKRHNGREVKGLNIDEFRENYELRTIIEAYCSMQGAFKAKGREIAKIEEILNEIKSHLISEKRKERSFLNLKFHESLVLCSQNKLLIEAYKAQAKKVNWPKFFSLLKGPRPEAGYKEHMEIFDAFVKKDGEKVRRLVEKHRMSVLEIMLENFSRRSMA